MHPLAQVSRLYNDQQSVILSLFHNATHDFRPLSLVIFFLLYFCLSLVCAGAYVPAGLFVPSITRRIFNTLGWRLAKIWPAALLRIEAIIG